MKHYFAYLKKKPRHIQQAHAIIFAGSVTAVLSFYILYTEYGFWHERYVREVDSLVVSQPKESTPRGPVATFSRFLDEAKNQLTGMKVDTSFLEGKEVYVKPQ